MFGSRELISRRAVLAAGGGLGVSAALARAAPAYARTSVVQAALAPVAGPRGERALDLEIGHFQLMVGDRPGRAMAINQTIPGPLLRFREGEEAVLRVTNRLEEIASIHWHGIILPPAMDGVPGVSFGGIAPGETFTYRFPLLQSGTYWCHSHSGGQELLGVYAPFIIDPAAPEPFAYERDYVVMLSDWSFEPPEQIIQNLKKQAGYYNYQKRTVADLFRDAARDGWPATLRERMAWTKMRMDPTDFADVTGYTYTYLVNGLTANANWTGLFTRGERVRLRFIAAGAMTYFDIRIPGLKMTVVAADGNDVNPVPVDELRIGVAERYDVIVEPKEDMPYTLFAESIDRAGYARATLATSEGEEGPVPERRPRALLGMADMGMAHAGHDMADTESGAMDHGTMDHGAMNHAAPGKAMEDRAPETRPVGWESGFPPDSRVLAYKDLRALRPNSDNAEPTRTIELRLTGNMERYVWTLDDARFVEAQPIRVRYGERVRLTFVNETMMAHPMHLHGMFFELETGSPDRRPLKDTVIVPPGQSVSVVLTAREVGAWPLHCHLLYHMVSGMMTAFIVEPPETAESAITPDGAILPIGVTQQGAAHGSHAGHGSM